MIRHRRAAEGRDARAFTMQLRLAVPVRGAAKKLSEKPLFPAPSHLSTDERGGFADSL